MKPMTLFENKKEKIVKNSKNYKLIQTESYEIDFLLSQFDSIYIQLIFNWY